MPPTNAETSRMRARDDRLEAWDLWGPYLSDRQWGTVREDYSEDGRAWEYFPFEHSAARAYRWGEDGLLGICDSDCRLCFAPAFWNGRDPILKERPFGLANGQGNHGEDVKDYYFHLDATPTASYLAGLYKYPQREFPYRQLLEENARRSRLDPEFELCDTGIFAEGRYFDILVEYAKAAPADILIRISAANRGPERATLHLLPTLWFRNTWSWGEPGATKPEMHLNPEGVISAAPWEMPVYHLYCDGEAEFLFTENETNAARIFGARITPRFSKDAFHEAVIADRRSACNPANFGTKAAAWRRLEIGPGESAAVRLRLCLAPQPEPFGPAFDETFAARRREADEFHESLVPGLDPERALIHRRAVAGLIWSKKFYYYDVARWIEGDPAQPPPPIARRTGRNSFWKEIHAHDILAVPDPWEYPYFCAWDLMFHSVAFSTFDAATAKRQNMVLRGERYTSPSSQQPAYEWEFSDTNPPIGAWAAWRIFSIERAASGQGDLEFLKRAFHKLMLHYAWWANRVDQTGDNVFEGGFLGLDNIGIFDRRHPLPDGSRIEQSDGTAWMAMFALNMLNIALELAKTDPACEDIADKFLSDFIYLAAAINAARPAGFSLWDEEDGFYYDVLKRPDGSFDYLKTRSVAGLTPLFAVESFDMATVERFPLLRRRVQWVARHRPHLLDNLHHIAEPREGRVLLSLVSPRRLARVCERLFDEGEFLSPHGIRSLSRVYLNQPYTFREGEVAETLCYSPGDSPVAMFGGNSNWRGPVWMPINYLLIESLQKFDFYFGSSFQAEFPTGSGRMLSLWEISLEIESRLVGLFLADGRGRRPCNGNNPLFDQEWSSQLVFSEYFHGETGRGLGASHQTGWTALAAKMIRQLHTHQPH